MRPLVRITAGLTVISLSVWGIAMVWMHAPRSDVGMLLCVVAFFFGAAGFVGGMVIAGVE